MHQINLNDALFEDVQRRATAAGFANVDDYVADLLVQGGNGETPNLDQFFTPERMAAVEEALADAALATRVLRHKFEPI
jgi:hypothetical protein